jgi:hypothetical protein
MWNDIFEEFSFGESSRTDRAVHADLQVLVRADVERYSDGQYVALPVSPAQAKSIFGIKRAVFFEIRQVDRVLRGIINLESIEN